MRVYYVSEVVLANQKDIFGCSGGGVMILMDPTNGIWDSAWRPKAMRFKRMPRFVVWLDVPQVLSIVYGVF